MSDNEEIRIVATWSCSLRCSGNGTIKNPSEVSGFLELRDIYEGVECVFGFTNKCFCVACNDLNNVPIKGLGPKPLRINLEFAKEI